MILGLLLGTLPLTPTVSAKTVHKTLSYDGTIEEAEDFAKGEGKNIKTKKTEKGVELSLAGEGAGEYLAPVIEVPFKAMFVGLHWQEETADENLLSASVRSSEDGKNFGEWVKISVEMDEHRDNWDSDEIFGALVGIEKASFVQAKFEFSPQGGKSPKLKKITVTCLNTGEESARTEKELSFLPQSNAEGVGALKTSPNGHTVNVISREDWDADETIRLNSDGTENWPRSYHGTRKLVVHHTADPASNGQTDLEANKAVVRAIYQYHTITRGFGDIGYNALVDASGNVYEGRYGTHGSIQRTDPTADPLRAGEIMELDVEAGHMAGYNSGSFGVSALGDFTSFTPPTAQVEGIQKVLAFVGDSRGVNLQGKSDFRRYDGSWHLGLNNGLAHRDGIATACPGDKLYAEITNIKSEVDRRLDPNLSEFDTLTGTINGFPISGTNAVAGTINFSWSEGGATKYQYVLERVHGVTGSTDNQTWQSAWFDENSAVTTTTTNADTSVGIDSRTLLIGGNYVFYVRALDADGKVISTVAHLNFTRSDTDVQKPIAKISSPTLTTPIIGIVPISASATDNLKVTSMKLYIGTKLVASSSSGTLNYNWSTAKIRTGSYTLKVNAYDAKGNVGETSITVRK
jgi:hypothetical protein